MKNKTENTNRQFRLKEDVKIELGYSELMFLLQFRNKFMPELQFYALCDALKDKAIETNQVEFMDEEKGKIVNLQGEKMKEEDIRPTLESDSKNTKKESLPESETPKEETKKEEISV